MVTKIEEIKSSLEDYKNVSGINQTTTPLILIAIAEILIEMNDNLDGISSNINGLN